MKRAALIAPLLCAALALPVLPLAGQDAGDGGDDGRQLSQEEFPWPDFVTVDPLPGRYRVTVTTRNLQFSGLDDAKPGTSGDLAGGSGLGEPDVDYVCLAGPVQRVDWLEEFGGQGACTASGPSGNDDDFRLGLQCNDEGGGQTLIRLTGSATDQGLDLLMAMVMRGPDMGKMRMDIGIALERVGECE